MKKIGVLTSYFATNFGATLQCYALKSVLENLGYDVEYIRYKQRNLYKMFCPYCIRTFLVKNPIALYRRICQLPQKIEKWEAFKKFRVKYIQPDTSFVNAIPQDKDFYILGSDQIWNPYITHGFDDTFWGQFPHPASSKVLSYAASTENMAYTESDQAYIKKAINDLDYVSVREDSLNRGLQQISGRKDIITVIDPTLLAKKNIYEKVGLERPMAERFVLFYKIRKCTPFIPKLNEYAKSIGAKLLILSSSIEKELTRIANNDENIVYKPLVGVEYFLSSVKYAEHVFTPSFHGTAFSIIFQKKFNTLVLEDNWNARTEDLLAKLNLSDRRLKYSDVISQEEIDYDYVNANLEKLRENALSFIKNALN